MLLSQMWFVDPWIDEEFRIPTRGDLAKYGWAIPVEVTHDLKRWQALLDYEHTHVGSRPFLRQLVETAGMAASTMVGRDKPEATDATSRRNDLLQNTHDMVWVSAQKIDDLLRRLDPDEEEMRNRLNGLLGPDVLNRLAPSVRQLLTDAERIFADRLLTPHLSLMVIGNAFEQQIMKSIRPLVEHALPEITLYNIEALLRRCPADIRARFSDKGLDPNVVERAISRVRYIYNGCKHKELRLLREEVREIREDWYGLKAGVLGVFRAITGSGDKSTI